MARLIDTETAHIYVSEFVCEQMKNIPTADAEEVVRCGKCKYFTPLDIFGDDLHGYCFEKIFGAGSKKITRNDFCSHGVRKEEKEGET